MKYACSICSEISLQGKEQFRLFYDGTIVSFDGETQLGQGFSFSFRLFKFSTYNS